MFSSRILSSRSALGSSRSIIDGRLPRRSLSSKISHKQVYTGNFGSKIRWLRRISLSSTIISTSALPVTQALMPNLINLSLVGQIAIFSAISLSSFTSTVFLQAVTHAYVHSMVKTKDSECIISRINWLGNMEMSKVHLQVLEPVSGSEHPFANFKDGKSGRYFYFEAGTVKEQLFHKQLQ
jgi:hypothetical protein